MISNLFGISLQDIVSMLDSVKQLSPPSRMLQALAMIHLTDLETAMPSAGQEEEASQDGALQTYCTAQGILLHEVCG